MLLRKLERSIFTLYFNKLSLCSNRLSLVHSIQHSSFGSKKQKEKTDKETKKLRKLFKISNIKNEEFDEEFSSERTGKKSKIGNERNHIDYKEYDIKINEITTSFNNKLKQIFDTSVNVETFNSITISKDKKTNKFSDITQIVIKSPRLIYFYPYMNNDLKKIIYSLKLLNNQWNPKISEDGQYVELHIPSATEEIKIKKRKEGKELLEKIKSDIRGIRHKMRDEIEKNLEGDEWKIIEKNKLDNFIKDKIKNIEGIYENVLKGY